ncbi:MAG: xanthine dehydrogenase small subunit [Pararhodobacter sp.]|nr:xanthine dehydrogenase small subunit [Pararhodobacter sp.]
MSEIAFLLNGTPMRLADQPATRSLLDWLREERRLAGAKEGCNEGDCGACTVMVSDSRGTHALNACILFLPQLHGKAVRTVEGLGDPDGTLHPVQQAMIDQHASQCGFCTPGFVAAMAVNHLNGESDHDTALAGNLCRCTGYAPIIRAAEAAACHPVPQWLRQATDPAIFCPKISRGESRASVTGGSAPPPFIPKSSDDLAQWFAENPQATLIAGATDVGLWVTKQLREPAPLAFIAGLDDLRGVTLTDSEIRIGATTTLADLHKAIAPHHPSFAELIRRFGSAQVRAAATIGGNIANGSPIGDTPPALIALGAMLHLRRGDARRAIALEDFFIEYGKQDRAPGEFVEAVSFPRQQDRLRCYKISKRFDQDISALCGCFNISVENGTVSDARIAFGGMAGTPKRALAVELELIGNSWTIETAEAALPAFDEDFQPIDDMRASASYRLETARNLLLRYFHEDQGTPVNVLEVAP